MTLGLINKGEKKNESEREREKRERVKKRERWLKKPDSVNQLQASC